MADPRVASTIHKLHTSMTLGALVPSEQRGAWKLLVLRHCLETIREGRLFKRVLQVAERKLECSLPPNFAGRNAFVQC